METGVGAALAEGPPQSGSHAQAGFAHPAHASMVASSVQKRVERTAALPRKMTLRSKPPCVTRMCPRSVSPHQDALLDSSAQAVGNNAGVRDCERGPTSGDEGHFSTVTTGCDEFTANTQKFEHGRGEKAFEHESTKPEAVSAMSLFHSAAARALQADPKRYQAIYIYI